MYHITATLSLKGPDGEEKKHEEEGGPAQPESPDNRGHHGGDPVHSTR
jgi:hypothetical protein